jgi:Na+-driven multidrug efflux pump
VAEYAQQFVVSSLPSVFLSGMNDSQKKFLNCFKKNYVPMVTNAINVALYPVILYLFVFKMELGILGLAMTDNVSIFLTLMSNLIYTWSLKDLEECG